MFRRDPTREERRQPENRLRRIAFESDRREDQRLYTWLKLAKHLLEDTTNEDEEAFPSAA